MTILDPPAQASASQASMSQASMSQTAAAKAPAPSKAARPVGRPRCLQTHKAILAAAADLLETMPYRDISMERIAAAAGVGKQTIYRWYDCKADLMLDAYLARLTETLAPVMLGGDAIANLRACVQQFVAMLPSRTAQSAYRALFAEAQFDPQFRQRYNEIVLKKRYDIVRGFVIAAVHRRQIRDDVDPEIVVSMIFGPILQRFLTYPQPPDPAFADTLLDTILTGVAPKAQAE